MALAALLLPLLLVAAFSIRPAGPAYDAFPAAHDVGVTDTIVEDMRHGDLFLDAAQRALRADPQAGVALPALARVQSLLPDWGALLLLWLVALATATAWARRLPGLLATRGERVAALLLLAVPMVAAARHEQVHAHDAWAALLVAWSLAERRPGRWVIPAALATVAMLMREAAAAYAIVMACAAWRDGERREAIGWGSALLAFAGALIAHRLSFGGGVGGLPLPWFAPQPPWTFAAGVGEAIWPDMLPLGVAGAIVGLAMFGWTIPPDPLALRAVATATTFAALVVVSGGTTPAALAAPFLPMGLVFVPRAVRPIAHAALDKRRITVTRITR